MPRDEVGQLDRGRAARMDEQDPLAGFRSHFVIPPGITYMDGNSLGLMPRAGERAVLEALEQWKVKAIGGWMEGEASWINLGERLGERVAPLVGAAGDEVVVTGTTTVNIHALLSTFYRPTAQRQKILVTELDFPSDLYAVWGQLRMHYGEAGSARLLKVPSRDGNTLQEDDIIALMSDDVALAFLPSVLYRSGQLLDLRRLVEAGHQRGILVGLDCCHSVGVVPHELSAWGVDFAVWCHYKYMNAGPGATAGLYVNRRHADKVPLLAGWWGYRKERQFDMSHHFEPQPGARGFQVSSPAILSTAALQGSLELMEEIGIEAIRSRSLRLTGYLLEVIDQLGQGRGLKVVTPRCPERRGGHIAISHRDGEELCRSLAARGIVVDFRHPDIVRIAPSPLYSSFTDVWRVAMALDEILG